MALSTMGYDQSGYGHASSIPRQGQYMPLGTPAMDYNSMRSMMENMFKEYKEQESS